LEIKIGDNIEFYLFGMRTTGKVINVNKDKTVDITTEGYKYPKVQTFKTLPRKKKDIPPWYILKK
jgi:predicted RNA-binding protein (virulence factor B family)